MGGADMAPPNRPTARSTPAKRWRSSLLQSLLDQGVLDRGVEVAGTDRLEEAAADLEGVETVLVLFAQPPTGNEQDRHVRVHRAEPLGELPAIHAGHAEIRADRVEAAGPVGGEGGGPARGGGHGVARALEQLGERRPSPGLLVDDQHAGPPPAGRPPPRAAR